MNSVVNRLFVVALVVFVVGLSNSQLHAQGKGGGGGGGGGEPPPNVGIGYRVRWLPLPVAATGVVNVIDIVVAENGVGDPIALVVGWYLRTDRPGRQAFVYDHYGFIDGDQPGKFWDINELTDTNPPTWAPGKFESSFTGVNRSGRVCGSVKSTDFDRAGVYFDLKGSDSELQQLPSTSAAAIQYSGRAVTEFGDILITGGMTTSAFAESQVSTFNPTFPNIAPANLPMLFNAGDENIHFNSVGPSLMVLGQLTNGSFVRHTVGGNTESFAAFTYPRGINTDGKFSCTRAVQVKKNSWKYYAARVGANGAVEWQLDRSVLENIQGGVVGGTLTHDLNNSGDVIRGLSNVVGYYQHEGNPAVSGDELFVARIRDLIIAESDPNGTVRNGGWVHMVSDRDDTGFGWLVGSGVGSFLLIPEILP